MTREFKFMCVIPQGYTVVLGPRNALVATHPEKPILYLDESTMQWRVLEVHISEVAKNART